MSLTACRISTMKQARAKGVTAGQPHPASRKRGNSRTTHDPILVFFLSDAEFWEPCGPAWAAFGLDQTCRQTSNTTTSRHWQGTAGKTTYLNAPHSARTFFLPHHYFFLFPPAFSCVRRESGPLRATRPPPQTHSCAGPPLPTDPAGTTYG